jgi:protein gp37
MTETHIQWTDSTWNPWHGCKKVSPGCKFCYMYRDKERYGQSPSTVLRSKTNFRQPLKWKEPSLVFTCSWSDFFIEEADDWRPEAWEIIKNTPHLQYQILTKRPDRIAKCLPYDWGDGYENVWLGVSGEDEDYTYNRLVELLKIPAKVRFLSAEPLIGDAVSSRTTPLIESLDWVIIGGESGNETGNYRYRPMDQQWAANLIQVCSIGKVACFHKRLGTALSKTLGCRDRHGGELSEWPKSLQVRGFPSYYEEYEKTRLKGQLELDL